MPEVIRCPNCGQANRVPDLAGGKKAVCGKCKTPLISMNGDGHPVALTDANFADTIARGRSVVDFWAAWCGPCRMIAPILEQLASERRDVRFAKLNVDENPGIAAKYGIMSIPTLMLFKDGQLASRQVGAQPKQKLEQWISGSI